METRPPPLPVSDDELLPLSAVNDYLFCPRRCALHRVEQIWTDNQFTLEGTHGHRRVHVASEESHLADRREVRGMWLRSDRLRLIGIADLVEFGEFPYPVEYKRGRKRRWDNDDVQLCAQALCLEEMLGQAVPRGAIFHLKTHRRREVELTAQLRQLTLDTVQRLHALVASQRTPPPVLKARCRGCSVREQCFPVLLSAPGQAAEYLAALYRVAPEPPT